MAEELDTIQNLDFGWSDLGTWGSLSDHISLDKKDNTLISKKVLLYESENNIVKMPREKVASMDGIDEDIFFLSNGHISPTKDRRKLKNLAPNNQFDLSFY